MAAYEQLKRLNNVSKSLPLVNTIGLHLYKLYRYIQISNEYAEFKSKSDSRFTIDNHDRKFYFLDATCETPFDRHYIYHPAWAARIIAKTKPAVHVDISSTLHFCSILSAFVPVKFYDYRPADLKLSDLSSGFANIVSLPFPSNSIESLSCMHTVEHIGLGRYGDPLDPDGDLKAIAELKRVLAVDGNLLFVVPIGGSAKIMFNAHRIYTYSQIVEYFSDLQLVEFSLIPDAPQPNGLITNATEDDANECSYGCGCFWFKKEDT
jgi:SAM-dependent methyltransferase